MNRIQRSTGLIATLALLVACPTAKRTTPGDSGSNGEDTSARTSSRTLVRPETMPRNEPSMRGAVPAAPLPAADTATGDRAMIARLEREARAIARTTGCTTASACRTAPVGVKACGGPRTYIAYCAATTDTLALARTLRELERVERAWNARSGMMSTCEMQMPPATALVGGSCREVAGAGGIPAP